MRWSGRSAFGESIASVPRARTSLCFDRVEGWALVLPLERFDPGPHVDVNPGGLISWRARLYCANWNVVTTPVWSEAAYGYVSPAPTWTELTTWSPLEKMRSMRS